MRYLALCLLAIAVVPAVAQQVQQFPLGSVPVGVAFDTAHNRFVVSSSGDNSVVIVDLSAPLSQPKVVTSVNTASGIAIDNDLALAVVTNPTSNSVTVINLDTLQTVGVIPVQSLPYSVAINTTTHVAVVANSQSNSLSLIDLRTLAVTATITNVPSFSGYTQTVAVNSGTNIAVVANGSGNNINIVDLAGQTVLSTVPVGAQPIAVAINPRLNVAVVCNIAGNNVSIVDLGTQQVNTVSVGNPQGVAVHIPSNTALISSTNEVDVVDLVSNTVVNQFSSLSQPRAVEASPVNPQAVVVQPGTGNVALLTLPSLTALTVVNGASFRTGDLSAGALATALGFGLAAGTQSAPSTPLPTQIGETKVKVGTILAPLFSVSPNQINFQIPSGVPAGTQTVQVLRAAGAAAGSQDVVLAQGAITINATSPGLFTFPQNGAGLLVAFNPDGSLVFPNSCIAGGKPAAPGSVIQVYGTGQGPLSPAIPPGQPAPSSPASAPTLSASATVGGFTATIVSSSAAPGLIGVWQLSIRIPQNVTANAAVPVAVTIGGRSSPSTATLPINTTVQQCSATNNALTLVNLANFQKGPVAPGELVEAFGIGLAAGNAGTTAPPPLPTQLGETTVTVGGVQASLFAVTPAAVVFQIPIELIGLQTVQVLRNKVAVGSGTVIINGASPVLFTQDRSGSGAVLALNGDGSLVSADGCIAGAHAATTGGLVQLFGMGQGTVNPPVPAGRSAPSNPLSNTLTKPVVTLGAQSLPPASVPVVFSGAAPGQVGIWQVNLTIPAGAPSGVAVPLSLSFRGRTTTQFLTLAVNTATAPCAP